MNFRFLPHSRHWRRLPQICVWLLLCQSSGAQEPLNYWRWAHRLGNRKLISWNTFSFNFFMKHFQLQFCPKHSTWPEAIMRRETSFALSDLAPLIDSLPSFVQWSFSIPNRMLIWGKNCLCWFWAPWTFLTVTQCNVTTMYCLLRRFSEKISPADLCRPSWPGQEEFSPPCSEGLSGLPLKGGFLGVLTNKKNYHRPTSWIKVTSSATLLPIVAQCTAERPSSSWAVMSAPALCMNVFVLVFVYLAERSFSLCPHLLLQENGWQDCVRVC